MDRKDKKWTYVLIGVGCGIVFSGIFMVVIGLRSVEELSQIKQGYLTTQNELEAQIYGYEQTINQLKTQENVTEQIENEMLVAEEQVEEAIYKTVDIPTEYTATQISNFLQQNGIVEDKDTFLQFLREQVVTTKLRTGIKTFPINGDYQVITDILLEKDV